MSHTALYRKLRPSLFLDVVGQDHIVRTLQNQIINNHLTHAYLFCGTRGTGKTTMAKLLAKTVNCKNLQIENDKVEPCNKCESCVDVNNMSSMNVIEIDAASNNGVDNIRDINDEVKYPPTNANYRVYIIDEVHMLSTGAFNALLKTLEEPPAHVIFILATTDPQKIPQTILSRCQRFDFKRITAKDIVEHLREYCESQNINISDEALMYIAEQSDGAMRDALSLLDQSISFYYGKDITYDNVLEITGAVDKSVFFRMVEAIANHEIVVCINIIDEIVKNGRDVNQFVAEFVTFLRDMLVIKSTNGEVSGNAINVSVENMQLYLQFSEDIEVSKLILMLEAFSKLQNEMKGASNTKTLLEILCIRLSSDNVDNNIDSLVLRIKTLEDKLEKGDVRSLKEVNETAKTERVQQKVVKRNLEIAIPEDIQLVISEWDKVNRNIKKAPLKSFLKLTEVGYKNDRLCVVCRDVVIQKYLSRDDVSEYMQSVLAQMYQKNFDVMYILEKDFNNNSSMQDDERMISEIQDAFGIEVEVIE